MTSEFQSSSSQAAVAQPSYVFRGHSAQIHSVCFIRKNSRLVTGDADGWVVFWKLESKRPVAVWQAHGGAILGTAEWGLDRVATHGRDNTLKIWRVSITDEANLSTTLPADSTNSTNSTTTAVHRPQPWLLHSLAVNTLNFCPFSMCHEALAADLPRDDGLPPQSDREHHGQQSGSSDSVLVAVPAPDDKMVDVHQLPSERLAYRVPRLPMDTGMVMAVKLIPHWSSRLLLIAGYEGGFTAVHLLGLPSRLNAAGQTMSEGAVQTVYLSQPHTQPILSLDVSPSGDKYFTSSADAIVAVHQMPAPLNIEDEIRPSDGASLPMNASKRPTSHDVTAAPSGGQLSTNERSSSPSSESDSNQAPSTSSPATAPLASPLTFSKQSTSKPSSSVPSAATGGPSLLSAALSSAPAQPRSVPKGPSFATITQPQAPFKVAQTKHAGQQSLCVRSDGRILATGGWDSRIRVYSASTLKELAVLKWHKEGVYAVGFAQILDGEGTPPMPSVPPKESSDVAVRPRNESSSLSRLRAQREEKEQRRHWIAAGSKDGKVSLWEIY